MFSRSPSTGRAAHNLNKKIQMLKRLGLIFHDKKQSHITSMRLLYGSFSNLNLHDLNPRTYETSKISNLPGRKPGMVKNKIELTLNVLSHSQIHE